MPKRSAGVLILDPHNRALLLRRSRWVRNPGRWNLPGGQVDEGEALVEAAARECLEEAGFVPATLRPLGMLRPRYRIFLGRIAHARRPELNWEHDDFRWCTLLDAVGLPMRANLRKLLHRILA